MKNIFTLLSLVGIVNYSYSQCTTLDATDCVCKDNQQNQCELLPDITISWYSLETYLSGPTEYSQTGNGVEDGRLRITGSTPNIGHGSFTVRGSDYFVCGSDTMLGDPGTCPNGDAPRQLITQRVYVKDGNTMTYYDRWAGAMTYHPTHGHNHVDDWGVFTLRIEDPNEPDPRNWPIVGDGAKLGFCLMDYGTCSAYAGDCRDTNHIYGAGNVLLNGDFPNFGLGGGSYGCSPVEQGISSGYTDIYSENLDGMWINIPPGTCNGDYWIVAVVDPNDNFLEEDETNNYTLIPFTLTQQEPAGNPVIDVTADRTPIICSGETVTLTASAGQSFLWNTGDTTQTIQVSQAGQYNCTVTNYCGTGTSGDLTVTVNPTPGEPTITGDSSICVGASTVLTASGTDIIWYDSQGNQVATGNNFTTPTLNTSTSYFAEDVSVITGTDYNVGPVDNSIGSGGNFTGEQWLIFDTYTSIKINSVKVYASGAGTRTFTILDQGGNLVQQSNFYLTDGENVVPVNFEVPAGNNFEFRANASPDLYRSNSGVSYPYTVNNVVSIKNSSAGSSFYYFFYDWQITEGYSECPSPQASINVSVDSCLAINDLIIVDAFDVYPNPTSSSLTLEMNSLYSKSISIDLVDITGRTVYTENLILVKGLNSQSIDVSHLNSGIYTVNLKENNKTLSSRKFIKSE